jgi:hypothetical protein
MAMLMRIHFWVKWRNVSIIVTLSDTYAVHSAKRNELKKRAGLEDQDLDRDIIRPLLPEDSSDEEFARNDVSDDDNDNVQYNKHETNDKDDDDDDEDDQVALDSDSDSDDDFGLKKKSKVVDDKLTSKNWSRRDYHDSQKGVTAGGGLDKKRSVSEKQYDRERIEHEEEEKEAIEIQRLRSKRLNEQDYGIDLNVKKKGKSNNDIADTGLEKTKNEKLKIIMRDAPELIELVADLKSKLAVVHDQLHPIVSKVKAHHYATQEGISYLEVKLHLLLSYCTNVMFYLLLKSSGKSVKDHPVISQLVEMRLLLEKIRPIDERMKYQIDKLISLANRNDIPTSQGNMDHKPRPDQLADDDEDEEEEHDEDQEMDREDDGNERVNALYVPPKLMPVAYDEKTNSRAEKERRRLEERVARAPILQTVKNMLSDAPEELAQIGTDLDLRPSKNKLSKEVEEYEMENFTRLQLSKKEANKLKREQESIVDPLRELDSFADLAALDKFMKSKKSARDKITIMQYSGDADEALKAIQRANNSDSDDDSDNYGEENEDNTRLSKTEQHMRNSGILQDNDDDDDEEEEEEEEEERPSKSTDKKRKRSQVDDDVKQPSRKKLRDEQDVLLEYDERDVNGKRKATPKMLKNRGLAPSRKKEKSNPRVKLRNKFGKATSRMVKQLPKGGSYSGQSSINSGMVQSRHLK